ncbi:MAG: hypothetical protein QGH45_18210 [Myxococcota bacterium]|jgi:hypothetical protein|nr:hypothetical protein [Myxococcota bacterium]
MDRLFLLFALTATLILGCPVTESDDDDSPTDDDDDDDMELPDYTESACYGDAEVTYLFDHDAMAFVALDTTCRAEGDKTMLFVDDEIWDDAVDQEMVNTFMHRFEIYSEDGAYDMNTGILGNNEAVFGGLDVSTFPNEKLHIFVVNTDGYGDGYVCPTDYGWCDYYCLHIDGLSMHPIDGDYSLSVTAHETYHIIHHFIDGNEHPWVDESLAEAAMTANGFFTDDAWLESFLSDPDYNWGPGDPDHGAAHYGAFLLWGTYLWEQGSADLLGAVTAESSDGWTGIDAALADVGIDDSAYDLYLDMIVAIYLDDPGLGYGFESFDFDPVSTITELAIGDDRNGHLQPYGIDYYDLDVSGTVEIEVTTDDDVVVLAVAAGADATVEDVSAGGTFTVEAGEIGFLAVTAEDTAAYTLALF